MLISYKKELIFYNNKHFKFVWEKKKRVKDLYKTFVFLLYIQLHNHIKTQIEWTKGPETKFITPGGHMKEKKKKIHNHWK